MARELGMTPKSLGKLTPDSAQLWKAPLPVYLEELYEKRFGRPQPESVLHIETGKRVYLTSPQPSDCDEPPCEIEPPLLDDDHCPF